MANGSYAGGLAKGLQPLLKGMGDAPQRSQGQSDFLDLLVKMKENPDLGVVVASMYPDRAEMIGKYADSLSKTRKSTDAFKAAEKLAVKGDEAYLQSFIAGAAREPYAQSLRADPDFEKSGALEAATKGMLDAQPPVPYRIPAERYIDGVEQPLEPTSPIVPPPPPIGDQTPLQSPTSEDMLPLLQFAPPAELGRAGAMLARYKRRIDEQEKASALMARTRHSAYANRARVREDRRKQKRIEAQQDLRSVMSPYLGENPPATKEGEFKEVRDPKTHKKLYKAARRLLKKAGFPNDASGFWAAIEHFKQEDAADAPASRAAIPARNAILEQIDQFPDTLNLHGKTAEEKKKAKEELQRRSEDWIAQLVRNANVPAAEAESLVQARLQAEVAKRAREAGRAENRQIERRRTKMAERKRSNIKSLHDKARSAEKFIADAYSFGVLDPYTEIKSSVEEAKGLRSPSAKKKAARKIMNMIREKNLVIETRAAGARKYTLRR